MSLFDAVSNRIGTAIKRVGQKVTLRRRGGGQLVVPEDTTFTVEAGETVRFESVDTSAAGAELIVNGTLITDSEENIENAYGNLTDESAGEVLLGKVWARRMYIGEEELPDLRQETGGKTLGDSPVIVFPKGTIAQRDDRVTLPGGPTYELRGKLVRDTHVEFSARRITQ